MMRVTRLILILSVLCLIVIPQMVSAQTIPEEARRHMARGQAAVEMAKSPDEYDSAIKEFQQASRLAPDWPDPYYQLANLQEKTGKLKEAVASLKEYLRLAPNAPDAAKIQEQIYKLEYKAEQVLTLPEIIDVLLHGRFRGSNGHFELVKGNSSPTRTCRLRETNGQLQACDPLPSSLKPCLGNMTNECVYELCPCLPVIFDGKKLEYECTYYRCPDCEDKFNKPSKLSFKRDIVSTSPLRIRTKEISSTNNNKVEYEDLMEWVNDR